MDRGVQHALEGHRGCKDDSLIPRIITTGDSSQEKERERERAANAVSKMCMHTLLAEEKFVGTLKVVGAHEKRLSGARFVEPKRNQAHDSSWLCLHQAAAIVETTTTSHLRCRSAFKKTRTPAHPFALLVCAHAGVIIAQTHVVVAQTTAANACWGKFRPATKATAAAVGERHSSPEV